MSGPLQLCCRVCLALAGEQICALSNPTLQTQLGSCLDIKVSDSDDLPTNVCIQCVQRLSDFYAFQTNTLNCQHWLEATVRSARIHKQPLQPLADSDYNSDSLLEFLNNTENIEEYLDGLGDDTEATLPSLVGLLDRQPDASLEIGGKLLTGGVKVTKITSTKAEKAAKGSDGTYEIHMEIDVLDSDGECSDAKEDAQKELSTSETNAYACLACKAVFSDLGTLSSHMSICEFSNRTCFECGLQFDSRRKMIQHRASHAHGEGAQACAACGKKFANKVRQLQHYDKCHNDFVAKMGCMYRCKECGDFFRDRFLLYRHARDHIEKGEASRNHCDSKIHNLSAVLYRCKVCRIVCSDRRELYTHVKQHTTSVPEHHLCHECGKSYTSFSALRRHVENHGDSSMMLEYKCKRCNVQCVDEAALQRHLKFHEREAAICEFCGHTFLKLNVLQKHVKEHHS